MYLLLQYFSCGRKWKFYLNENKSSCSRGNIQFHAGHCTHFQAEVESLEVTEVLCTPLSYFAAQNVSLTKTICYMS